MLIFAQVMKNIWTGAISFGLIHIPKAETFSKWAKTVPDDFCFAVKVSRYITHRYAFEFRHESWFDDELYRLFERHRKLKMTLVMAYSSSKWPLIKRVTGSFAYIRMHGAKELYASKYSAEALRKLAAGIRKYQKQKLDVYVYFNNDVHGYAIDDAALLQEYLHMK